MKWIKKNYAKPVTAQAKARLTDTLAVFALGLAKLETTKQKRIEKQKPQTTGTMRDF